jgi:ABC-2 type transport system permease protein
MATVAVRFVFPSVSVEGRSFWIIRTSPVSMRDFLWSKFWTGLVPVFLLTELVTVVANEFLGVDPFLKMTTAVAVAMMSVALVGLATGMGARYPRFGADPAEVSGSFGGVAFMIQAVLFVIVMVGLVGWPSSLYVFRRLQGRTLSSVQQIAMLACFAAAVSSSVAVWLLSMRSGVRALEKMAA